MHCQKESKHQRAGQKKKDLPCGNLEMTTWGFGQRHQAVISGLLAARTPGVVRDVHVVSVRIEPGSV